LEPLYGILLAFIILGKRPGLRILAGGVIIVAANVAAGFLHKKNKMYTGLMSNL